ncbi:MAG: hypothetical protein RLY70_3442, partial [Planctomycetota bacterium]
SFFHSRLAIDDSQTLLTRLSSCRDRIGEIVEDRGRVANRRLGGRSSGSRTGGVTTMTKGNGLADGPKRRDSPE